jgi:hypothetical protein
MEKTDFEMLKQLAKDLANVKKTKQEAINSLAEAGIMTKKGKFTKQYECLNLLYS